jgi:hypothetical protein
MSNPPDIWFKDLEGKPVEEGGLPVTKIFVIDPKREFSVDEVWLFVSPEDFEQVVWTNASTMDVLAAFSGAMPSRGQARKNGFGGPIPQGLEMFGVQLRSFWVWNPHPPAKKPTVGKSKYKTQHYLHFREVMGWPIMKMIDRSE